MQPWFIAYFFDIGHPCYGQLTAVKTRYPLTCIIRGLKLRTHRGHVFFFKLTVDQVLIFDWIAGSCQVNLLAGLFESWLTLIQDYKC